MKIVFKNLRKKMAYARVVRINQRLALIKQQEEELTKYIEWANHCNNKIAVMSAQNALYQMLVEYSELQKKRSDIIQKVFGGNDSGKEN